MAGGQSAFGEPSVVLPNQEVAVFGSCQSGKTMLLQRLIDKLCGHKTELCGQILDAGGRHERCCHHLELPEHKEWKWRGSRHRCLEDSEFL